MTEKHCIRCGEPIADGSEYCPTCGATQDGSAYKRRVEAMYMDRKGYGQPVDTLGVLPKFIIAYGAVALVAGLLMLYNGLTVDGAWGSLADADGLYYGLDMEQYRQMVLTVAGALALSGVCAVASGVLANMRARYALSIVLCATSSVAVLLMAVADIGLVILAIVLMVVGLLILGRIRANRESFQS